MRLAVAGGKGGVGTSTVAYNLAAALGAVVVDADLTMPDLPVRPGPDLHAVLAGRVDPLAAVRTDGSVAILPCGRSLAGARAADPQALAPTIEAIGGEADTVVVDAPTGCGPGTALALQAAEAYVLVTTPDPVAVADAVRTRSLARWLDTGLVGVALNRAGPAPPVDAVAREVGAPAIRIPESPALGSTLRRETPIQVAAPESPAAEGFAALARRVQHSRRS